MKLSAALIAGVLAIWISSTVFKSRAAQITEKQIPDNFACSVHEPELDMATDANALIKYKQWASQLLKDEKFDQLECIAQSARKNKAKFAGGEWKLHKFYVGLQEPSPDMHATEEDWQRHLARVEKWIGAKPQSVTPRIVLAGSYFNYGWFARGSERSDTVSDSGWKLLHERVVKAETTLNEASKLEEKDPEWYVVMQRVALGEEWPKERAIELFQKATAFEPGYLYYHRLLANFLLPKWNGEQGEASAFIKTSADQWAGAESDGVYFEIAADMACACEEPEFERLSWPRLKSGFLYVEKHYGISMQNVNSYTLMATRFHDPIAAAEGFSRIGDNWYKDAWRTETYFRQTKQWAEYVSKLQDAHQAAVKEAEANAATTEGAQYKKAVEKIFADQMPKCSDKTKDVQQRFDMIVKVGEKGDVQGLSIGPNSPGQLVGCLMTQLMARQTSTQMPLPVPPSSPYSVKVEVDPTVMQASAH